MAKNTTNTEEMTTITTDAGEPEATENQQSPPATAEPTTETEQTATTADTVQRFIYLGPNHPKGILVNSTIFKGGVPEGIETLLESCPAAKALLVKTDQAAAILPGLRNPNSAYAALYKQADEEMHKEE